MMRLVQRFFRICEETCRFCPVRVPRFVLAAPAGAVPVDTKFTLISYSGDWNGGVFEDYANHSTFTSGLNEWRIRYNDVAPGLNGGAFGSFVTLRVIPEPSSIMLLLAALFGLLLRRRA